MRLTEEQVLDLTKMYANKTPLGVEFPNKSICEFANTIADLCVQKYIDSQTPKPLENILKEGE
jgi:hypothetical protein